MDTMLTLLRKNRITIGDPTLLFSNHLVVLGLYEASRYRDKLTDWLPKLHLGDATLVVIDNFSQDDTWEWARGFFISELFDSNVFLIRNQMNFGGYGSIASNMDLLGSAKWITTLHQDDMYSPSHVDAHSAAILEATDDLGMISSEAVSVDGNGRILGYPKAAWLLDDSATPIDIFLAHLKLHVFPFSGASFRVKLLQDIGIPWHSTAFPDTELVMRASADWRFKYLNEPQVEYFENAVSESHLLTNEQRHNGAFFALVRVFRDQSFKKLCERTDFSQIQAFAEAIDEGITVRIGNLEMRKLLKVIAQESIVEVLGPNPTSSRLLAEYYGSIGDVQATRLLNDLSFSDPSELNASHHASSDNQSKSFRQIFKLLILRTASLFPRRMLKSVFVLLMKSKWGKSLFPAWDFKWKKK